MRLIDADALKEKKVYSHERHEKVVPVAEIDWMPTIAAITVEWLEAQNNSTEYFKTIQGQAVELILELWQKEQEANDT